ncbi:MAG: RNA 2',3'-cyclic phosphodiesterase [Stenotrophobium sp.]
MPEPNRLFFALWPDDASRAACEAAARDLRLRMQPGGYLIRPARYHMTLLFLGDEVPPAMEARALQVAHRMSLPPFMLTLNQAMSFRNKEIPWVLMPHETPPGLSGLYDALRTALRAPGVVPDRKSFSPHLTVLRNAGQMLPLTQIGPVNWAVQEFVLIRSVLHRQLVEYQVIGRWPLNGTSAAEKTPAQMKLWEN